MKIRPLIAELLHVEGQKWRN